MKERYGGSKQVLSEARLGESRLGGGRAFGGVDELADFGALFVEVGEVLFAEALIDLELLLAAVFCAGADVGLAEPVVRVGKVGI